MIQTGIANGTGNVCGNDCETFFGMDAQTLTDKLYFVMFIKFKMKFCSSASSQLNKCIKPKTAIN